MSDEAPGMSEEPPATRGARVGSDDLAEPAVDDLPQQMQIRRAKYDRLRSDPQRAPFPVGVPRTHTLAQIRAGYLELPADTRTGVEVGITGRVIFARNTGKLCFATLREDGVELQVMVSAAEVGPEEIEAWKADVDLGDQVFVQGEVITSRRGELSVSARSWRMTAKALRPLPVAHRPMSEETRVRQRYVDLIVRPDARRMVTARASVLRSLRRTLDSRGYIEVETPILNVLHGGAAARPFRTHLNAFDLDMTLRIATELYLKRAVIGGIDRVYELGRTFRNEGVDSSHSPEFTELEAYEAYADYDTMAELTRALVVDAARELDVEEFTRPDGQSIDLFGPWQTIAIFDAVSRAVGAVVGPDTAVSQLEALATQHAVAVRPGLTAGEIALELYEKLVEPTLVQPTFVRDYPADVRPLARPHRDDPRLAEAWDLVIGGVEMGVAYSELADPVEQRRRLTEQSMAAAGGDPDAMELDEDFLRALEYGLPPTGGMGLGVDRLIMLLTSRWGIRETILFPLLKPLPGGS